MQFRSVWDTLNSYKLCFFFPLFDHKCRLKRKGYFVLIIAMCFEHTYSIVKQCLLRFSFKLEAVGGQTVFVLISDLSSYIHSCTHIYTFTFMPWTIFHFNWFSIFIPTDTHTHTYNCKTQSLFSEINGCKNVYRCYGQKC